jgi:hypothetical protein
MTSWNQELKLLDIRTIQKYQSTLLGNSGGSPNVIHGHILDLDGQDTILWRGLFSSYM